MLKKSLLLSLSFLFVQADLLYKELKIEDLQELPRSLTKDFYIWQYLNQDISSDEADLALAEIKYMNNNLFYRYAKKQDNDETYAVAQCMQANAKDLLDQSDDCIVTGLSYGKALSLNFNEIDLIIDKLSLNYPLKAESLKVINSSLPFVKLASSSKEIFFEVFNKTTKEFRFEKLNYKLPQALMNKIKDDKRFNQTIKLIVTDTKLKNLQQSLIGIDDSSLNFQSSFLLALNSIINASYDPQMAMNYLENAYKKAYFSIDKDMVLFWQYQLNQEEEFLEKLSQSSDINIYSIYAKEHFNKEFDNLIFTLKINQELQEPTISQFDWVRMLQDGIKYDEENLLEYENSFSRYDIPYLANIYHRYYKYQKAIFLSPYEEYLGKSSIHRKSLIYAIARQESGFIPTSISSAYALGSMQIMPFLVESLSKEFEEDIYLEDMFNPQINIKYANKHLDYLESKLSSPLFVSYAYNGGIGYTNRNIIPLFKENLPYMPYMAIELVSYDETKQYGKKVLANYYIYINHLQNKQTKFASLIEGIKEDIK
ncbi:MAG: transglycosylase SLT domain-containing protein [Arcobacteraceae bacterium]|jgi:soluble lytic murein transglycosylase|nr:transglycosylase SLT domain-containing protein [Arcobacteraceae bacterium]